MGIKVIEQDTAERNQETKKLLEDCKPYLKKGLTLNQSVQKVKGINYHSIGQRAWYRELKELAEKEGY